MLRIRADIACYKLVRDVLARPGRIWKIFELLISLSILRIIHTKEKSLRQQVLDRRRTHSHGCSRHIISQAPINRISRIEPLRVIPARIIIHPRPLPASRHRGKRRQRRRRRRNRQWRRTVRRPIPYPATLRLSFKHLDFQACRLELSCARGTGGAGAYDGDAMDGAVPDVIDVVSVHVAFVGSGSGRGSTRGRGGRGGRGGRVQRRDAVGFGTCIGSSQSATR